MNSPSDYLWILTPPLNRLWRFSAQLANPSASRGVRRFHTIEEANAERERRIQHRIQMLLAERRPATLADRRRNAASRRSRASHPARAHVADRPTKSTVYADNPPG